MSGHSEMVQPSDGGDMIAFMDIFVTGAVGGPVNERPHSAAVVYDTRLLTADPADSSMNLLLEREAVGLRAPLAAAFTNPG